MAHFARLNIDNIVTEVVVVNNRDIMTPQGVENENIGILFCQSVFGGGIWKQTSYNGNFRKNYAGKGFKYDSIRDAFIAPQPFPSWTLNEDTCIWEAPTPYPNEPGKIYTWDENTLSWVEVV